MKKSRWIFAFLCAALFLPRLVCAGTLDDAPFRVVLPSADWQMDDSTALPLGKNKKAFLAATISNTNTSVKSAVIKAPLDGEATLDGICIGMRHSFLNRGVDIISEADTTFIGYSARTFTFLATDQHGQETYNRVTTFIADGESWTIAATGPSEQKDQVRKVADFFVKKK